MTEQQVETELFGQAEGSASDAASECTGSVEQADGGTLFFEEIGDIPLATQVKLLRLLEERQFTWLGEDSPVNVNVRVLAATNKDLQQEVAAGRIGEDLYYRLNVVTVHIDPLSRRRSDIMPLADHFRRLASRGSDKQTKGFSSELRKWLIKYRWPGNIEQLWQVVESLVEMDLDGLLSFDDLSPELLFSGVIKDCSGSLDLIASLSESDAECISKHTGKVSLGGLLSISDAEADLLSQHRSGELMLNGLEALSYTATKSLGNYQGILGLSGLRHYKRLRLLI